MPHSPFHSRQGGEASLGRTQGWSGMDLPRPLIDNSRIRVEVSDLDKIWELVEKHLAVTGLPAGPIPTAIADSAPLLIVRDGRMELNFQIRSQFLPQQDQSSEEFAEAFTRELAAHFGPEMRVIDNTIYRQRGEIYEKLAQFDMPSARNIPMNAFDMLPGGFVEMPQGAGITSPFGARGTSFYYSPQDTKIESLETFRDEIDTGLKMLQIFITTAARYTTAELPPEKIEISTGMLGLDAPAQYGATAGPAGARMPGPMTKEDFEKTVQSIVQIERPNVTFDQVKGQDRAVEQMLLLLNQLNHPEAFREAGAKTPRGSLLIGPPGTGKTLMAMALANETQTPFLKVSVKDVASKWYGDAENLADAIFNVALKEAEKSPTKRVIILFDEIDAIAQSRTEGSHEVSRRVLSIILDRIQGFHGDTRFVAIGATNTPQDVDQALLDRLDYHITVDLPDEKGRAEILKEHVRQCSERAGCEMEGDLDYAIPARTFKNLSGRNLADLVNDVAVRKGEHKRLNPESEIMPISTTDLLEAAKRSEKIQAMIHGRKHGSFTVQGFRQDT